MKTLHSALAVSLFLLAPIACVMETEPEEVATAYEYVEGERDDARCVDRPMRRDDDGRLACRMVEVRRNDADGRCDCDARGLREIDDEERRHVRDAVERDERTRGRDLSCACEVRQLERDDARVCEDERGDDLRRDGWCGDVRRGVDDALDACDDDGRRGVRLLGEARVREDAEILLRCD